MWTFAYFYFQNFNILLQHLKRKSSVLTEVNGEYLHIMVKYISK